jgi:dTDP-4-dehydrorhamnose 3,5-epimerase
LIFTPTRVAGAFLIELDPITDQRGFFARAFCRREFEEHGLKPNLVQCNVSFNHLRATLRGMHYQFKPHEEAKLVRCTRGAVYDVMIDLRSQSPTYTEWLGVRLDQDNRTMLYVPEGFAHGYLTLTDDTEVFYQVSEFYAPQAERGVRWNDRVFGIKWPFEPNHISAKDRAHPDFAA